MIGNMIRKLVKEELVKMLLEIFPEKRKAISTKILTLGTQDPKLANTISQTSSRRRRSANTGGQPIGDQRKKRQYRRRSRKNQSTGG